MCKINEQYAVFIDIDGTLLGKSDEAFDKNIQTIQVMRQRGHKFFISTGRGTAYLPIKLKINENFDGVISGAGSVLKYGNREIGRVLMPYELTKKFCEFVIDNKLKGVLEGEKNMYHFGLNEGVEEGWVHLTRENLEKEITPDTPIEKFTVLGQLPTELDELFADNGIVLRFSNYGEIIQKDRNKGTALLEILKVLNIPPERSVAIGDSMNDYEMLKIAGIGVAMGNAEDGLKEIADIITTDVNNAGVSAALIKIFGMK